MSRLPHILLRGLISPRISYPPGLPVECGTHMTRSTYSVLPHGLARREGLHFLRGVKFVSDHVSGRSGWCIIYAKWNSEAVYKKHNYIDFHHKFSRAKIFFRSKNSHSKLYGNEKFWDRNFRTLITSNFFRFQYFWLFFNDLEVKFPCGSIPAI